eukprot:4476158-Amphidinium_carterae.1
MDMPAINRILFCQSLVQNKVHQMSFDRSPTLVPSFLLKHERRSLCERGKIPSSCNSVLLP